MNMPDLARFLSQQPLLLVALVAIFVSVAGSMISRPVPWLGRALRGMGNLALIAVLLLTIAQAARFSTNSDISLAIAGLEEQRIEGGETRIPISGDGHFWVKAQINGTERRFLVDTGATLTAISPQTAEAARIEPTALGRAVVLQTANGATPARMASIGELRFGNVVARDLDAVIAPAMGQTNVIGMNLLSRLASWRVEGRTLILVPKNPQPEA
ncbi:TIGR02281 family clan AA aspartic protease [Novosphingobium sp.]|uniref:retropepsin-like aspartic protease family protein n=1 Tax=Novosphingobium sp. TaxID=1874826 RepID=UPI0025D40835|nr:TIGR02281 family clan AA aspartic protease [Novosphingobium sp.]